MSLVLPDEKFTIFASLGVQKNSEFLGLFDYGLMKQAETGTQRKVFTGMKLFMMSKILCALF